MGLFDWLGSRRRHSGATAPTWHVSVAEGTVAVDDGRGHVYALPVAGTRNVRIVPLTGGQHHPAARGGGWQVALAQADGDVLVGPPQADSQSARELARQVCDAAHLKLDDVSERLFSGLADVRR